MVSAPLKIKIKKKKKIKFELIVCDNRNSKIVLSHLKVTIFVSESNNFSRNVRMINNRFIGVNVIKIL